MIHIPTPRPVTRREALCRMGAGFGRCPARHLPRPVKAGRRGRREGQRRTGDRDRWLAGVRGPAVPGGPTLTACG